MPLAQLQKSPLSLLSLLFANECALGEHARATVTSVSFFCATATPPGGGREYFPCFENETDGVGDKTLLSAARFRGRPGLRVWVGVSVGGENLLSESLKASVLKNPLALSVVESACKVPLDEGDERVECDAELK